MAVFKFRNLKNGQATPVPEGEFTVGRGDDTYIHLEDPSVSRQHAKLFNNDLGFFVEDLGSANGTAAHGAYITQRSKIDFGDVVHIGSVPFRVDHEVEGEETVAPSAGMRVARSAYMRRDTERLPGRVVEAIPQELLSAPTVNPATDSEAGELNKVQMREPDPSLFLNPPARQQPAAMSTISVGKMPVPGLAPQRQSQIPAPTPRSVAAEKEAAAKLQQEAASQDGDGWGWRIIIFLAGTGTGLIIGLYFAKLFIEMGGKVASLP